MSETKVFKPIQVSEKIVNDYKEFIKTERYIKNPIYNELFSKKLDEEEIGKGPFLEVTDSFTKGKTIEELIVDGSLNSDFRLLNTRGHRAVHLERPLYKHQERAVEIINGQGRNAVITTGTGSGKTESFLYPIINKLMDEKSNGTLGPGVRALIVYPMNALANDQVKRLRELLKKYPDITFGAFTGETEEKERNAVENYEAQYGEEPQDNEIISRESMRTNPPNILISNYAMLEYLLLRPKDKEFFEGKYSNDWKYIVLDEAHTYYGALGIEVSMLLSRLKESVKKDEMKYILTSATLGDNSNITDIVRFAKNLTGTDDFNEDSVIFAERENVNKVEGAINIPINKYGIINGYKGDEKKKCLKEILNEFNILYDNEEEMEELVFNLITMDEFYFKMKEILTGESSVKNIMEELEISADELQDFVDVATIAEKNGVKPFDARYHMFLKTIEGCYISFGNNPKLRLNPGKYNEEGGKYFEVSVCKYCGEIYVKGSVEESYFVQDDRSDGEEYLLFDELDGFKGLKSKEYEIYRIDLFSGRVIPNDQVTNNKFKTSEDYHKFLVKKVKKVNKNSSESKVSVCLSCDAQNNHSGVTKDFYFGQMASTSVIGTSLYKYLPEATESKKEVVNLDSPKRESIFSKNKSNKDDYMRNQSLRNQKQYLSFSDSRQQAAYFSAYFNISYHRILRKKLLIRSLELAKKDNPGQSEFEFDHIVDILSNLIIEYDNENNGSHEGRKEAIKTILYEYVSRDRNSLMKLGIINIDVNPSELDDGIFKENYTNQDKRFIFNYLLTPFKNHYSIQTPKSFQRLDFEETFRVKSEQSIKKNSTDKQPGFIPKTGRGKVVKVISDIFKENYRDRIMELFFDEIINESYIKKDSQGSYQLIPKFMKIKDTRSDECYSCKKCNKIQSVYLQNYCANCQSFDVLTPSKPSDIESNKHYYELYTEKEILPMTIREHTAQLTQEQARKYQNEFIKKKINILSCSTTFEMGVDVGDLETVFMRNVPPSPANYIQRAGRAGRSSQAAAFSLTYSNLTSHDMNFFKNPIEMIRGSIVPPVFKRDNIKIALRHANSVILSEYFKRYPKSFNEVQDFFKEENIEMFLQFIKKEKESLEVKMKNIFPATLQSDISQRLIYDIDKNDSMILSKFEEYIEEERELKSLCESLFRDEEYKDLDKINKVLKRLQTSTIIQYLSRNNIIPKYGFPVDTVELETVFTKKSNNLRLSRDLSMAINEYAPDSEVIADGNIYKSRFVNLPPKKDVSLPEYLYIRCSNNDCKHLNMFKDSSSNDGTKCKLCGEVLNQTMRMNLVIPEYGFTCEPDIKRATTQSPHKSRKSSVYYMGDSHQKFEGKVYPYDIKLTSTRNDELSIINESEFMICNACGYSVIYQGGKKCKEHKNKLGQRCTGDFSKKSLGHVFKTDVVLMTFELDFSFYDAFGVLYSFMDSMSDFLGIDRRDISGTIEKLGRSGNRKIRFVLYDKVPGGAGHVKRLYDVSSKEFKSIFSNAYKNIEVCNCAEDSSCYSCLRKYENQHLHEKLTRQGTLQAIEQITNKEF